MAVAEVKSAPTRELGTASVYPTPTWGALTAAAVINPLEHVPELMWPLSVRVTYPRMRNDSQLSGLYRGTTLPIRRYVWGIDENGAEPAVVDAVCAELGLQRIEQAWRQFQTGQSEPTGRSRNRFSFDRFQADALKACYLGHYYFEQLYDVVQDGPPGLNGGWFAHLRKLAPRAPWTISQFYTDPDGGLAGIRQQWQKLGEPPIPVSQLVGFVFEQDPGQWEGNSLFRPCFREWLSKDLLYRIDTVNHEKAGGVLITEGPQGALPAELQALSDMSAALRVGGGGAVPAGSNPVFLRATGSDVIASINQRDEAMARAFLMMFMSLGTSSSGGNRALSQSFVDWFAIAQEAIAIWFRDVVTEHVIKDFVDLNWAGEEQVPKLVFKRPDEANPLDTLAQVATSGGEAGAPTAVAVPTDGGPVPVAATRVGGVPDAVVVDDAILAAIHDGHDEYEQWARPVRRSGSGGRAAAAAATPAPTLPLPLPDRKLRRQPYAHEVQAAVNFAQLDADWQSTLDQLVAAWKTVRAGQIQELHDQVAAAAGDLEQLATVGAAPAGADVILQHLAAVASAGALEAQSEARAQGVPSPVTADLSTVNDELATRAAAVEQLLARSLSQAAANKAVQLSGGGLSSGEVADQVSEHLGSLTDAYLNDQFGGATTAAQNAGRRAVMAANQPSRIYASELLDTNTCEPCRGVDGREYASLEEAAADYPTGGYRLCQGGPRCRGTEVAVYDEAAPTA